MCNVENDEPHESVARQRFLSDGPLAFLPLPPSNLCSIVWTTTAEHAAHAVATPDDVFCAMLAEAFDVALGEVRTTSARLAVPLSALHAKR